MQNLIKRLEKSGWGRNDINKAVNIMQNAKQNKTRDIISFDKNVYWILLVIIVVANFAISIALVPVLVTLGGIFLYFIMILLGLVFGLLFELVIRSIEHLEKRHHLILVFLIPLVALINMFIVARMSNSLKITMSLKNANEPIILSIFYAAAFVLPYIIYRFVLKIEYYAKE